MAHFQRILYLTFFLLGFLEPARAEDICNNAYEACIAKCKKESKKESEDYNLGFCETRCVNNNMECEGNTLPD